MPARRYNLCRFITLFVITLTCIPVGIIAYDPSLILAGGIALGALMSTGTR